MLMNNLHCWLLVAISLSLSAQIGFAQPFTDDFDDGNLFDGSPVTWQLGPASGLGVVTETVGGDLVLREADPDTPRFGVISVADRTFSDVSLRTQGKLETGGGFGLVARFDGITGYEAAIFQSLGPDNATFFIDRINSDGSMDFLGSTATGLPLGSEVVLEFDVIAQDLLLNAYAVNNPATSWQVSVQDGTYTSGNVGLSVIDLGLNEPNTAAIFRYFQAVPEPPSIALGVFAMLCGVASLARRGWLPQSSPHA